MATSDNDGASARGLPGDLDETGAGGEPIERAGRIARCRQRLGQVVPRRPPGVTANQWNTASRALFDFVVVDPAGRAAPFVVEFVDPTAQTPQRQRSERMKHAVCEAVGLEVLRIESPTLRPGPRARRIVEYVIDARVFLEAAGDPSDLGELALAEPSGFRDILGRLPDGRTGPVNDLGAVARAAAVDAYVNRELVDPILRSLRLDWKDGPAEGWAWLQVRPGEFLFERVRIWQYRFGCGIEPARLAEDLATMAVGERLRLRDLVALPLRDRSALAGELDLLRRRRDELSNPYAFDHVSFD
ncbi:DUF2726 domain-containing protein [Micromonospora sp. HM5-17]|jgi:hypothetical protein|uniref:DUF2726 domain-containing protein n=1 Tax=Micromonospora sp. HM5-17 TaxID=2487710 RepID=UPI000F495A9B|nr:DUF2726 domain-containing protein [Micromonospora sp. HM5-17]ROT29785.1 DUF2726 domain-containing protein [Micromonospora sp. HM5-17]